MSSCTRLRPSGSLTSLRSVLTPLTPRSTQSRHATWNAKTKTGSAPSGKKDALAGDARYALIRDMLYNRSVPTTKPADPARITLATATTPLPQPATASQDTIQHDAIERAWALVKQKEAVERVKEVRAKYTAMRLAMEELERTDARLFEAAARVDKEEVKVFPRTLRVPTETPPAKGWNYDMTPPE
ncbi:39S ribosomal protein L28, mitochondrial [Borealophlyctis nickersoniae]|nr:39S ribosomal protein L28, mitochondrial [Borealophlyctis nickersoniae]